MFPMKKKSIGLLNFNCIGGSAVSVDSRQIWEENVAKIEQHNLEYSRGLRSYTLKMNRFGDMVSSNLQERLVSIIFCSCFRWKFEDE